MIDESSLGEYQRALADAGVDGWLLFDFRGVNPIARELLRLEGIASRRAFALIPATGVPVAFVHAIEPGTWRHWPAAWRRETYSSWRSLEALLERTVSGRRVAMEYSPGDAVPYLDRIPAGVIEMVRAAGATVVSSGALVSRFYAGWSDAGVASHERAAEIIARIAHDAFALAGQRARTDSPVAEHELMAWIAARFADAGLETDHGPNVSAGANAANPHYEPSAASPRAIVTGDVLLIDLWATEPGGVYADQTWMGTIGPASDEARAVWSAIRDARDAAITAAVDGVASATGIRGADVDDAARQVIDARGYGSYFTHRTGHSIDARDLHGSGPHLDNLETREERQLVEGVGFSIEPGIYLAGRFGMRTEVNAYVRGGRVHITPREIQRDLLEV